MRIFIALLFEDEKKDIIYDIIQEIKFISKSGNFTDIKNLHLTIQYLGYTTPELLENIKEKLAEINLSKFNYETNRIKYFKKGNNKKIVYLGVEKNDLLTNLYNLVAIKLNELDYRFSTTKYTPHISLGRGIALKEGELISSIYCSSLTLSANRISVMESTRVNGKIAYNELFSVPLK
ncbi:RNA 2',3'-cyclic phosphodiesterase [Mycoplasmatota bacterium WC30]